MIADCDYISVPSWLGSDPIADIRRLKTVPLAVIHLAVIHRVVADPTDGARDVQRGRISAGSPGGDGGWYERSASLPGVRAAPGHSEQDCWPTPCRRATSERAHRGSPTLRQAQDEAYTGVIDRILNEDHRVPRKQRRTAKRIFERLRDEYEFDGGYTIVKDYVRVHRRKTK